MHITFVKKILADGQPCPKCIDVERRLADSGLRGHIDEVVIADERDADSPGMALAKRHDVALAPFFLVRDETGETTVYTVYLKFVREVFGGEAAGRGTSRASRAHEEAEDILRANPDLDLI